MVASRHDAVFIYQGRMLQSTASLLRRALIALPVWAVFYALIFLPSVTSADPRHRYREHMPDINALHHRLHDHSAEGPRQQFDSDIVPVKMVEPTYPRDALIYCRRGWVFLEFMVTPEGKVDDVEIFAQDSSKLFGQAALRAIKRWQFEPAMLNGRPVARGATLPIEFSRPGGCTEEPPEPHGQSLSDGLDLPVQAPEGLQQAEVIIVPVISALMGKPDGFFVHGQAWFSGDKLTLSTRAMSDDLVFQLKAKSKDNALPEGLRLEPEQARFARLFPVAESRGDDEKPLDAFFSDAKGRDLVLVYADRESRLTGIQKIREVAVEYSLAFPGAGFYWVEFAPNEDDGYVVRLAEHVDKARFILAHYQQ